MFRLFVYSLIALFLYGVFAYFFTPQIEPLSKGRDSSVNILVLTEEPLFFSYNPKLNKAVVNSLNISKKDLKEKAFLKKPPFNEGNYLYFYPKEQNRTLFWEEFKTNLYHWKNKPYIIFAYIYNYFNMKYHNKTDINFATFLMLSYRLSSMKPADFILKTYEKPKGRKQTISKEQITLGEDISKEKQLNKILVIEIFNASGKKGLALELTNYLRNLNNKGILKVDVIDFGNHSQILEETKIIDTAGRMESLKELLLKIGLDTKEIQTSADKNAISEAQIILGKDFIMPK